MSLDDQHSRLSDLTAREREVLGLIASGLTNGEIANRLEISFTTAKWHVSEIISKLGVASREEAVAVWKHDRSLGTRAARGFRALFGIPVGKLAVGGIGAAAGVTGAFLMVLALTRTLPADAVTMDRAVQFETADYASVYEEYVLCLEEHGFIVTRVEDWQPGRIGKRTRMSIPDADGLPDAQSVQQANADHENCYRTLAMIEAEWRAAYIPPSDAEVQAARAALATCMAAGGTGEPLVDRGGIITLNGWEPRDNEELLVYVQCAEAIEEETGIYPTVD
ncbi:MAG TPA: helix-turn-helix transcriptional regulator [Tepidiformaceae bacterium]|nr:helix-turn-helix transcriptional regulator [Tepidiformaceae bacterium]